MRKTFLALSVHPFGGCFFFLRFYHCYQGFFYALLARSTYAGKRVVRRWIRLMGGFFSTNKPKNVKNKHRCPISIYRSAVDSLC